MSALSAINAALSDLSGAVKSAVGRITALEDAGPKAIATVPETGTARTAAAGDAQTYVRFENSAAKTYTFNTGLPQDAEFSMHNAGAGDLTVVAGSGLSIGAPAGGSLVIPQGGTATLKIVASDAADLIGQTVAA